jgi:5'-methylthioadenosine phosphorylase
MYSQKQPDFDAVVIGGVGFTSDDFNFNEVEVNTPYGIVKVRTGDLLHQGSTLTLALIQRHTSIKSPYAKHMPPHRLNYRATVWAAKTLGPSRVIAINSVGTMGSHSPGSFLVPNDFIDLTRSRPNTFFDNETVHVDMTEPYCPEIRDRLLNALARNQMESYSGVYICTEGPRFETAAEIRMLSSVGDIVGMTGLPEVVLARELGLCYASLCIITNRAAGLSGGKLTADEIIEMLNARQHILRSVLLDTIASLPHEKNCSCNRSTEGARIL